MHIAPYDNRNKPIVDVDSACVPLNYFNIVKLKKGEAFEYQVPGYETCIVPATGTVDVAVGGETYDKIGNRGADVWDGEPEGVYVPTNAAAQMVCVSDAAEVFVAGAKYDRTLDPFAVRAHEIDMVQYGSDDTKTHRKIKHILGQQQHGKVGRLLVSELYTVGQGGWSGFPSHKHDTRITARACRCCSARTTSRATPITSSTAQRSASTGATTPARRCRATRCITSPSWAGSASAA
jgi:5-deoxy-glucuronate isomerase